MAIKSSDPRKIGESALDNDRFGRIVADAWMSRHEEETAPSGATPGAAGEPLTKPALHAAEATYQPFAELKELMYHEH